MRNKAETFCSSLFISLAISFLGSIFNCECFCKYLKLKNLINFHRKITIWNKTLHKPDTNLIERLEHYYYELILSKAFYYVLKIYVDDNDNDNDNYIFCYCCCYYCCYFLFKFRGNDYNIISKHVFNMLINHDHFQITLP